MPLGTAVKETVAQAIVTALGNITTAGDVSSFIPVGIVRPSRIDGILPADKLLVVSQSDDDDVPEDGMQLQGNFTFRELWVTYSIDCFCFPDADSSSNAIDTTRNAREADVHKALMTDPSLGGIVLATSRCLPSQWWDYAEFSGFTVKFQARIEHAEADMRDNRF